jgi:hypothetical protein
MDGITTGMAWVAGLGLPQILLWVLTFAVVFEVLVKARILSRAPAAIVSVITGLFVLMAVPNAVIQVIAGLSTGLITLVTGLIALVALLEVAGAKHAVYSADGKSVVDYAPYLTGHKGTVAAIMLVLAGLIFAAAGGLGLIGITALPAIGIGTWVLIAIGIAVLWMFSEAKK